MSQEALHCYTLTTNLYIFMEFLRTSFSNVLCGTQRGESKLNSEFYKCEAYKSLNLKLCKSDF